MLVKSLVAAAALAGAVSAAPLPAPDKAQPSSGGGYGHWPSNEDSPAAQPFSGGGYGHWPDNGSSDPATPSSGVDTATGRPTTEPQTLSHRREAGTVIGLPMAPSSGGGYGHWPSNDTAPGAQPSSGGGYGHWPSNDTTSAAAQPSSGGGYGHWPNTSSDAQTSTVGAFATRPAATSTNATQQAAQTGQPAPGSAGKAGLSVVALAAVGLTTILV
ncbi:hypothetical protein NBRC10512_005815 [Rhodotorula toruloides]